AALHDLAVRIEQAQIVVLVSGNRLETLGLLGVGALGAGNGKRERETTQNSQGCDCERRKSRHGPPFSPLDYVRPGNCRGVQARPSVLDLSQLLRLREGGHGQRQDQRACAGDREKAATIHTISSPQNAPRRATMEAHWDLRPAPATLSNGAQRSRVPEIK